MEIATATEIKNNFGKYLELMMNGEEIIITKNGKEVGRIVPKETYSTYLTDSLIGVLKNDVDEKETKFKDLKKKYDLPY